MVALSRPMDEFQALIRPLIGLAVALPWKGYGSAIFLELGRLSPRDSQRQHHSQGEASISVEWNWRVECGVSVLYGSSNRSPAINQGIASLLGTKIESLSLVGEIPELVVRFSNGHCLRSMIMVTGDPAWGIRLPGGNNVSAEAGAPRIDAGRYEPTVQEKTAFARAEAAATRWGAPSIEPDPGRCLDCTWFVPIDGDGHLLDYGVCIADTSPFDGRAVSRDSGCPSFTAMKEA
jgi:hypothetical protein